VLRSRFCLNGAASVGSTVLLRDGAIALVWLARVNVLIRNPTYALWLGSSATDIARVLAMRRGQYGSSSPRAGL
jgi:hypothetical protein